jgi:hypothetical protein
VTTPSRPPQAETSPEHPAAPKRNWPVAAGALTAAAAILVFLALVVPDQLGRIKPGSWVPGAFLRIPIEGIFGAALLTVLPRRPRRVAAVLLGAGLGLITVLKIVNIGFLLVLARRFDPVGDWSLFQDGYRAVDSTDGHAAAIGTLVVAIAVVIAVPVALTLAVLRLGEVAARHRTAATRTTIAAMAVYLGFSLSAAMPFAGSPTASDTTVQMAKSTLLRLPASIADRKQFAKELVVDAFGNTPPDQLLTALKGKDVVFGVVESYGRSALTDPLQTARVDPALAAAEQRMTAAGFAARSAYVTSATYGGGSWLGHSTLQSGLWIDNQSRYRTLIGSDRLTLMSAFHKGGWQTFGIEPGNTEDWPEATFYGVDKYYDDRTLGYEGPSFGWSSMPDQYTLKQFQDKVYGRPGRAPLTAEVTLTSSHEPWGPVPQMVDWDRMGSGEMFAPMAKAGKKRATVLGNATVARTEYARSIAYSMTALTEWISRYADRNLVMIIFGDHQASSIVSGTNATHDVPISIVAKDPAVLDRISSWGWQIGLRPNQQAPTWRMDAFRDKFLTAYGSQPDPRR